ncbi:acetyl-CoA decarbonylase/synthase complex subunit gamma, partial [Candidatus Bathyarchaeota archaeon]|nr:acetyl-CoA decarbonylase/synthase complex subunit gamma [Candidatus Bathyarchaeota archaeon]
MTEREIKGGIKELSPIDVYMLLPRTNCKECGEENCMAFAVKLVSREVPLEKCPPILKKEKAEAYKKLQELLAPPVREVVIGLGKRSLRIGGKLVMHRHEFTYHNPPPIAIDVTDEMPLHPNPERKDEREGIIDRIRKFEGFSYDYIGKRLNLDAIALRSTSGNPETFKSVVRAVTEFTDVPLILCSLDPAIMDAGLSVAGDRRPLIYAATKENWKEMAELALKYSCPLSILAPNDLSLLRSLARTLIDYGLNDLVLDPGTFPEEGIAATINNFTMIRRCVFK